MDPIAIASLIVGIIALYFGWLQIDHRFKKNRPESIVQTDLLKDVLEAKVLRIGWFNYPPFISGDKLNPKNPIGLYPLLAQKVASKFNLEIQWLHINLSDSIDTIKNRKVDIIVSVFQTPNRARHVDFTSFLHSIIVGGVSKSSVDIHSQSELLGSNYSIVVAKNEIGHELVDAIKIPYSRITVIDTNEISKVISFVKSGEADIVLLDAVSIKNYFKNTSKNDRKNIKQIFVRRPLAICHSGIMIPQNQTDFANWLDTEFRLARDSEEMLIYESQCLLGYEDIVSKS
jgi:ABC-type amino acid transport substrate-binding protein